MAPNDLQTSYDTFESDDNVFDNDLLRDNHDESSTKFDKKNYKYARLGDFHQPSRSETGL